MKKLILIFLPILLFFSCKTSTTGVTQLLGASMKNSFEKVFSNAQFDSICAADKISKDLNKWKKASFINGENGQALDQYMYIKKSLSEETIYRLQVVNQDSVKITKRVTK